MQINHIALIVSKEENLSFYQKLGFQEYKRFTRNYDVVVLMEHEAIILEIFIDSKHPDRVDRPEALGLRHIAFTVDNLDDITKLVECEPIRTDWFGRRFTFAKDLDGQPVEFKEV